MATIIVSPIARDTARMNAAVMPENAAGTTTRRLVCILVAPSAYAPSRRPRGTPLHRVLGERRDQRQDHDAHDDAGAERVEAGETGNNRCRSGVTNSSAK